MTYKKEGLQEEIENTLLGSGATIVGFAHMGNTALSFGSNITGGISIAAALDPGIIKEIKEGPTIRYFNEYRRANKLLSRLGNIAAGLLEQSGFRTVKLEPTEDITGFTDLSSPLPHKTVATRAGMGWIGKTALLVTRQFGSAVRLNSVLTDMEFEASTGPVTISECGECNICVEECPAGAANGKEWNTKRPRDDFFNAFKCHDTAKARSDKAGIDSTICGRCIVVCPWTKKYLKDSLRNKS